MTTICTTTTLDCPTRVLVPWVNYHLNMGIDHMYLFFDNPEHPGIAAVAEDSRITCVRCDAEYWPGGAAKRQRLTLHERQWFNANRGLQFARERNFDWIAHIDSDELLYFPGRLQEALERLPEKVEVVRFRVFEAIPAQGGSDHPFAQIRYFRVGPMRPTSKTRPRGLIAWCRAGMHVAGYYSRLGVAKAIGAAGWGPFLRGHTGGKSAVRVRAPIQGMGVHVPAPPRGRTYLDFFLPHAALLHYDCADFDSWLTKWLARASESHVPRNRDAKRRRQLTRFRAAQNRSAEAVRRLYEREYLLREWKQRFLMRLGLVREICLPDRWFAETTRAVDIASVASATVDHTVASGLIPATPLSGVARDTRM